MGAKVYTSDSNSEASQQPIGQLNQRPDEWANELSADPATRSLDVLAKCSGFWLTLDAL